MQAILSESVAELLAVVFYAGIAGVLALLGVFFERASLEAMTTGQSFLGAWDLAFGALLLYAGYNVVVHLVRPRLDGSGTAD